MGIYLNPGKENFKSLISGDIYVDKTMMLEVTDRFIDKGNKYVCVSRPRRFGKTIAGNMLAAYYSIGCDSAELFSQYKIASSPVYGQKLNKYNVIKIDMNSEYQNTLDKTKLISRLTRKICREMTQAFPDVYFDEDDSLAECLLNVYSTTGETFILLIDEYDEIGRAHV